MGESVNQLVEKLNSMPKKKVALINPPSFFLTDDKVFSSLGLLSLAGVLGRTHHQARFYDLAGREDYLAEMQRIVNESQADVYGITSTSPQYSYALQIQRAIREASPYPVKVAIGGPHASMMSSLRQKSVSKYGKDKAYAQEKNLETLQAFDQIIEGEEGGLVHLLGDSKERWVNGGILSDLDGLPILPRELIDMKSYLFDKNGKPKFDIDGSPATSLMSQRGCPYGCNFCSGRDVAQYRQMRVNGQFRAQSPDRVIAELNHINQQFGVKGFMFYDDELNLVPDRTFSLLDALIKNNKERQARGLDQYSFRGFVKSEQVVKHPKILPAMKEAGFSELLSGFESGSDRLLRTIIKKNTTRDINLKCARLAFDAGMSVKALTMVGHPTEKREDLEHTMSFLDSVGKMAKEKEMPWNFDLTVLCPYPGSPIYDNLIPNTGKFSESYGRVLGDGELYVRDIDFGADQSAYKTATGENQVYIRTNELSSEELLEFRNKIDSNLREKYGLKGFARAEKDIMHSM